MVTVLGPVTILIPLQDMGTVLGPVTGPILLQDTGTVLALVKGEAGVSGATLEALFQDGVVDKDRIFMVIGPTKTQLVVQIDFTIGPWLKIHGSI